MKNKILLTAAILMMLPLAAQAQSKQKLQSENAQLRSRLEAMETVVEDLQKELEGLKMRLAAYENVPDEVLDYYTDANRHGSEDKMDPSVYSPELTDSLLSMWYIQRQMRSDGNDLNMFNIDSVRLTTSVPDEVLIERLQKMNCFMKLPYNETVRNCMVLYSEKMPRRMSQMLGLAKFYMPYFEEIFRKYELPMELKYLCVIESAMNPTAVSWAGAAGMWQFIYSSARHYGLQIDNYVDERLDPFKECDAAARMLKENYRIFGDWCLAISAYNCGPGNVNKAIHRAGGSKDYWTIYEYLPQETRRYVPGLVGAIYAFHYAKEYGLEPAQVQLPAHVDTFHINKNLHFRQVSEMLGIPMDEIRSLNHQYYRDIVPGKQGTQVLRLPYTYSAQFAEKQEAIYAYKADEMFSGQGDIDRQANYTGSTRTSSGSGSTARQGGGREQWTYYTVKRGDSLGKIANKYHTTVSNIKKWNNLRGDTIHPGDKLKVGKR